MSVMIKSAREIEMMRMAGHIVANTLQELRDSVAPGMTTKDLDIITEHRLRRHGAEPAFPYINDFPGSVCVSVNNEVVHGIPGSRRLQSGDLLKLDVGAIYEGYHGDAAITVPVGEISDEARQLMDVTEHALAVGIEASLSGGFLHDVGAAIQDYVEPFGYGIVRKYVGHGVGRRLHEDPTVPHFRQPTRGIRLRTGMTFTIEPMINAGAYETKMLQDGWTVVTEDGSLSAQFEHTVLITDHGPEILSLPNSGAAWGLPAAWLNTVH